MVNSKLEVRSVFAAAGIAIAAFACAPQGAETLDTDESPQESVGGSSDSLMTCTATVNGYGSVGDGLKSNFTISSIVADGSGVLKIGGHDTTGWSGTGTPPAFNGLISLGTKGVKVTGSFGDPSKVAFINNVSFDSAANTIKLMGVQQVGRVNTAISGVLTVTGAKIDPGGMRFSRANRVVAGSGFISFYGYDSSTRSFLSGNWNTYGDCTTSASVVGTSGSITLNGKASGAKSVRFLVDGAVVGSDATEPFAVTYDSTNLINGTHNLKIEATDETGNVALSANAPFTTSNAAPPTCSVAITPSTGSLSGGTPFFGSWKTTNATTCSFQLDGGVFTSLDCKDGTTDAIAASYFGNGSHTVTLKVVGAGGTRLCTSNIVTVSP